MFTAKQIEMMVLSAEGKNIPSDNKNEIIETLIAGSGKVEKNENVTAGYYAPLGLYWILTNGFSEWTTDDAEGANWLGSVE